MRFIWITAWKDLNRLRRDPLRLVFWIGIPLMLALIMNTFFGGDEAKPQGRLLLADEDGTFLSNILGGAFSRNPGVVIVVEAVTREQGRARIDRGDGSALLIIPKGFQDAFFNDRPAKLQLFTNPSQRILPKIVEETLAVIIDGGFYIQRVAGDQLRALAAGQSPSDEAVVAVNRLGRSLNKFLDPPLVELETTVAQEQQAQSFAGLFLPGMIFMAMVFLANGLSHDIWIERSMGTLRRAAVTPAPFAQFLAGRLMFVLFVGFSVALVGLPAMRWAGVTISNLPLAILWLTLSAVGFYLILLFASVHSPTEQASGTVVNLLIFPMMLVGGCFFPFEVMPAWLARIGQATPVGWTIVKFKAILAGSLDASALATSLGVLALAGALVFPLVLRRLRRKFLV
jgi:ABC-type multidrug transport system permease subunit